MVSGDQENALTIELCANQRYKCDNQTHEKRSSCEKPPPSLNTGRPEADAFDSVAPLAELAVFEKALIDRAERHENERQECPLYNNM
mmetsp:Transcript_154437/g.287960  ORF Transcript_154437/g.287960 Transcript_154437/m.287960 type:complete len:87 (-) Transcript_154437:311-571(-)